MKRSVLKIAAGIGLLALVPAAAMAHTDVSVGLNLGGGYYAPAPAYVAPAPVYYRPAPAYYAPTVAYRYGGYDRWEHRRWEEHRWHEEHQWHDHHDRDWRR
jgi:hypothetical protein